MLDYLGAAGNRGCSSDSALSMFVRAPPISHERERPAISGILLTKLDPASSTYTLGLRRG
jgi:hypothetical protein